MGAGGRRGQEANKKTLPECFILAVEFIKLYTVGLVLFNIIPEITEKKKKNNTFSLNGPEYS